MIFYWPLAFCLLIFLSSLSVSTGHDMRTMQSSAQVEVLGGQFLAYREAVVRYARANPGVTGGVADGALELPNWLTKPEAFKAYVQGGESFAYFVPTGRRPSLVDMGLYPDGSVVSSVGIAAGGALVSGTSAATGRTLPAVIPSGAIVYVN
ncbi:type IV pilus biogenesis protein PilM [Achromobacter xylosoxidans]|uniref:type IV pilus biogenesis protein PilM n=1 Tax=Achromobacter ruhlandii TaxID=72557 RepID=UPI003B9C5EE3